MNEWMNEKVIRNSTKSWKTECIYAHNHQPVMYKKLTHAYQQAADTQLHIKCCCKCKWGNECKTDWVNEWTNLMLPFNCHKEGYNYIACRKLLFLSVELSSFHYYCTDTAGTSANIIMICFIKENENEKKSRKLAFSNSIDNFPHCWAKVETV